MPILPLAGGGFAGQGFFLGSEFLPVVTEIQIQIAPNFF
jgi:hypothetical protein